MAAQKSRLGRGLGSLIAAGVSSSKPASPTPSKTKSPKGKTAKKPSPRKGAAASPLKAREKRVAPAIPAPVIEAPALPPTEAARVETPAAQDPKQGLHELPLDQISPNPHQPRREFDEEKLRELAESIRSEGLLQPVVVRKVGAGYQLIAGERRWRACQALGLTRVPAHIVEASEVSSAVLSLIENLQRADLNPLEEALGYASLLKDFGLTQEAVAERVGKSRAAVANSLRLLQLDREIQGYLNRGILSVGHAKVLLGVDDPAQRSLLARQVIERGASVRETERLLQALRAGRHAPQRGREGRSAASPAEAAAIDDFQKRVASFLNTPVSLKHAPKKGRLVIEYFGNDDLQRILEKMGISAS